MPLNQLPAESSPKTSSRLLPATLLAALSLALSACDKSIATSPEATPSVVVPTGTMDDVIPTGSTQASRKAVLDQIIHCFQEARDAGTPITGGITQDPARLTNWRLAALGLNFGPQQTGTHMVTIRQKGSETSVYDMVDIDSDGSPDVVEYSVSSPTLAVDGTPMTHSDKSYVVDGKTNDMYAAGLEKAKEIFEAKAQLPQHQKK